MKIPSPSSPAAPKYWQNEQGGELQPAVLAFLHGDVLTVREVALMRAYLKQWIDSPVWNMNPHINADGLAELEAMRKQVQAIVSERDIRECIGQMVGAGMNPL